jgi:hypothetical protein
MTLQSLGSVKVHFVGGRSMATINGSSTSCISDGRSHERLARLDRQAGWRHVYLLSAGPLNDGAWNFAFAGSEPITSDVS